MPIHETGSSPWGIRYIGVWWEEDDETKYTSEVTLDKLPKSHVDSKMMSLRSLGYVRVVGSDEKHVAKVLTETVAGFKLELPLLREAKKQGKM